MALLGRISFFMFFVAMWYCGFSFECEQLDNRLQKLCSMMNAGYNFTAGFSSVNGVRYQDKVYLRVSRLQSLFRTCSNVSKLMVCSTFVPKCSEGQSTPVLPCRDVCEQFVEQCERKLEDSNLKLLYSTLCPVLPDGKADSNECIKPKGFKRLPQAEKIGISLSCPSQTIPACQQGNYSRLPEDMKIKLIERLGQGDPLLKSACSEQMKSYSCYEQTTPCFVHGDVPYRPCRSFCEQLKRECDSEIRLFNLSFPLCDELSERDRVNNLCRMDSWPVPWPNITNKEEKPMKTCYCDTCGMINKTCQTNGSCFIQSQLTSLGLSYTQQTCLQPGKEMDFICRYTKDYPYAKCCDQDYCNKDLELMSEVPTTTAKPTSLSVTRNNITTTGKPTTVSITNNKTSTKETMPTNIVITTQKSSSKCTVYAGIYTNTINGGLALVLATILR